MCGLSGFLGLHIDKQMKLMLVLGLADGIDNRGGHSCGYVSVTDDDLRYARKKGVWVRSRLRFIEGAAGDVCMMHARYATCGNKEDPNNAHPFAIRRNGRVVMWGAHNGMVPTAFASAKAHGRDINVDSQEIFELLADKEYEGIRNLSGYGVVTWIDSDHREYVNIARLSTQSDICIVSIKGGGVVWASTWKILREALRFADLEEDQEFELNEIGRVYRIRHDGVYKTKLDGIKVGSYSRSTTTYSKKTETPTATQVEIKPADDVDEAEVIKTKVPGAGDTSYKSSGAYSPHPSAWGPHSGMLD